MSCQDIVVVITDHADTTASRVEAELALRGIRFVRFDVADFPKRISMAATCGGDRTSWQGEIWGTTADHRPVQFDLAEIAGIYFRKPTQFQLADGMSGPEQQWAYREARRGFGGVLQAASCVWVNHPVAIAAAEYKPVQLASAGRSGLAAPATLITSDPEHAYSWAKSLGGPFVCKPLGGAAYAESGRMHMVYTTRIDDPEQVRDPAVGLTAHLFQAWVDKAHEARAIIIGERVFAVAIHAGSADAHIDWRSDYDALTYEIIDLPSQVRDGLLALHRDLGLTYGAADLAITEDGQWMFYETNPNGQWGWLAQATDLPVAPALADLLCEGAR